MLPDAASPVTEVPGTPLPAQDAGAPQDTVPVLPEISLSDEDVRAQRSPELARCLDSGDAAKGVSVAMGGCFNAELALQDERLNAAYKSAMAKRDADGQARLRADERAWIKRRDAQCKEAATGGTIDMVEIPACLLDETIRRRIALQPMAE